MYNTSGDNMKYEIGRIANTHGIRGELKIKTDSDFDRFTKGKVVYLMVNEEKMVLNIKSVKEGNGHLIIKFEQFDDINQVEFLKGQTIYTDEAPELEEDEFHYQDLIGKEVFNQHQVKVGVVKNVIEVPQGHLLQIQTASKLALVPFVSAFIKEINDSITIEEIEGLL